MRPFTVTSLILLITSILLSAVVDAAQIPQRIKTGTQDGPDIALGPTMGSELEALLKPAHSGDNDTYAHAITLISSLKTSPSCTRIATSTLLKSCQQVQNSKADAITLDEIKSVYAARLAVCELLEAGAAVPSQCSSFAPADPAKPGGSLASYFTRNKRTLANNKDNLETINFTKLVDCLKGLGSRPQWWTSYTNARQNAVIMCQAVRGEIEKDELLDLHKAMADVTSSFGMSLSEAVDRASTHLARQNAFAEAVEAFQREIQEDFARATKATQSALSRLLGELESNMQRVFGKLTTAGQTVEAQYAGLSENILRSTEEVDVIRENIGKLLQEFSQGSSELVAKQASELKLSQELLNGVMGGLEMKIGVVYMRLNDIQKELEISKDRSSTIDKYLLKIHTEFDTLEARFEEFRSAQDQQHEIQSHYHELLHTNMQGVLSFMEQATTGAENLQSIVNETSRQFEDLGIPALFGLLNRSFPWLKWLTLGVMALNASVLGFQRYVSMASVILCVIYILGWPDMIISSIRDHPSHISTIWFILTLFLVVIVWVIIARWLGISIGSIVTHLAGLAGFRRTAEPNRGNVITLQDLVDDMEAEEALFANHDSDSHDDSDASEDIELEELVFNADLDATENADSSQDSNADENV